MKHLKYFNGESDIKKQYKELSKKYHPDNGGNNSDFQDMKNEYDSLNEKPKLFSKISIMTDDQINKTISKQEYNIKNYKKVFEFISKLENNEKYSRSQMFLRMFSNFVLNLEIPTQSDKNELSCSSLINELHELNNIFNDDKVTNTYNKVINYINTELI